MTLISKNYARVLYELGISTEAVDEVRELIKTDELVSALKSPVVSKKAKHNIVEKIFPKEMWNFMKVLCDYDSVRYVEEILKAYDAYVNEKGNCIEAELICVEAPSSEQKQKIEQFLMSEYEKEKVKLIITIDDSLLGGFILKAYDMEYDWSFKGRISRLAGHLKNI